MTFSPHPDWIVPDWPAPARVRALFTTRPGGVSVGPHASLNLGLNAGDDVAAVQANRARLAAAIGARPGWLAQVHGTAVANADQAAYAATPPAADASVTVAPGVACAVLVADCLPVLLCDVEGRAVGAAHAGWRGLCAGVIEQAVATLRQRVGGPAELLAWLGPSIGPTRFEVGAEVRDAFLAAALPGEDVATEAAFTPVPGTGPGSALPPKYLASLPALARLRLARHDVTRVFGGTWCTYDAPARFYSYRRDRVTGRMAAMVWLEKGR